MNRPNTVLVADDDRDDCLLLKEAFEEAGVAGELHFVHDGEELMEYLHRRGRYQDRVNAPWPAIVLLDLNMPRMDGRECLREIKTDPALKLLRVVILTTSSAEEDVVASYSLSATSFITKPVTYAALADTVHTLTKYWLQLVQLCDERAEGVMPESSGSP